MKKIFNSQPDKSISHRAIILSSIANGKSIIKNPLLSDDCINTIKIFKNLGVDIKFIKNTLIVHGVGLYGLKSSKNYLDVGNSGTSIRLISGILAMQKFSSTITGDDSIKKRPMKRIINPLTLMGANIKSNNGLAPIQFCPPISIKNIEYDTNSSSAQVKSCLMLASLYTNGKNIIIENFKSRNHTELMLQKFGIKVIEKKDELSDKNIIEINGGTDLKATNINIPGDISSASFLIVAALITPDLSICIKNVGLNPTRTGIIDVCKNMGAKINIHNYINDYEPYGDIDIEFTKDLKGIEIKGSIIPRLIDEIPIISLLATQANGTTKISGISDLKNKESNRIKLITENLKRCGCNISSDDDSIIIYGKSKLKGADIITNCDHRIAMMFEIASLISENPCNIDNKTCINTSYPRFYEDLKKLKESIE